MSRHCSFRIGGPCDAMLLPSSVSEVETVCALLAEAGEKPLLIGNGTNLLVTDAPLHRIVLRLGRGLFPHRAGRAIRLSAPRAA